MIGSILQTILRTVLESVLSTFMWGYSKAGWDCIFECYWERLESLLSNVLSIRLGLCHQVCLREYWELSSECTVKPDGSMPSIAFGRIVRAILGECVEQSGCVQWSAIRSVHQTVFTSMRRSALGNFVECSMYSIKRTYLHVYHSNLV